MGQDQIPFYFLKLPAPLWCYFSSVVQTMQQTALCPSQATKEDKQSLFSNGNYKLAGYLID